MVNNDGDRGYPGSLNERCATLAETFRAAGYATRMTGKWHLSADRERANDSWPMRRGFSHYSGTLGGRRVSSSRPDCMTTKRQFRWKSWTKTSTTPTRSATGPLPGFGTTPATSRSRLHRIHCPHWPLHAKPEDLSAVHALLDEGWDPLRAHRRQRQIAAGICAKYATLDIRDPEVPAWGGRAEQGLAANPKMN